MVAVYRSDGTGLKPATCYQTTHFGRLSTGRLAALPECGNHLGAKENLQKKCYVTKYQPIEINAKNLVLRLGLGYLRTT